MKPLEEHAIMSQMLGWREGKPDTLEPEGETVFEVIDHWMACRADIFEHSIMRLTRYCLTDDDVRRLAEHVADPDACST